MPACIPKPPPRDLHAASFAVEERAAELRDQADEKEREPDHPRYQSPIEAAAELRERAEQLDGVARWLEAHADMTDDERNGVQRAASARAIRGQW